MTNLGIQLAPAGDNLIPASHDFSHSSWVKMGNVLGPGGHVDPMGNPTAYEVYPEGNTTQSLNYSPSNKALTPGNPLALSFWVWMQSSNNWMLQNNPYNGGGSSMGRWDIDGAQIPLNQWVHITKDHPAVNEFTPFIAHSTSGEYGLRFRTNNTPAASFRLWGVDMKDSAYTSSLVITSGTEATRAETSLSNTFENLPPLPPAGIQGDMSGQVVYVAREVPSAGGCLHVGTGTDEIDLNFDAAQLLMRVRRNGTSQQVALGNPVAGQTDARFKLEGTELVVWMNGARATRTLSLGAFTNPLATMRVGADRDGGLFTGVVRLVKLEPKAIPEAEIVAWPHFPVGRPVITGTPVIGNQLSVSLSNISDLNGPGRRDDAYVWYRSDGRQVGTEREYTVTEDDATHRLQVSVAYRDDANNPKGPILSDWSATIPELPEIEGQFFHDFSAGELGPFTYTRDGDATVRVDE